MVREEKCLDRHCTVSYMLARFSFLTQISTHSSDSESSTKWHLKPVWFSNNKYHTEVRKIQ